MAIQAVSTASSEGRPFQIVFMDIRMPNLNGTKASLALRENGFQGLIAACTADSSGHGRSESKASGIDAYFDKRVVNKGLFAALLDQSHKRLQG